MLQGIYLWCNYIELEFKFVYIVQYFIQFCSIIGNVDFFFILSLFQGFFFQDNFIQCVMVQSNCGISVFCFSISCVVQYVIFQFKFVFFVVVVKVNIKYCLGIICFFIVDMYSQEIEEYFRGYCLNGIWICCIWCWIFNYIVMQFLCIGQVEVMLWIRFSLIF